MSGLGMIVQNMAEVEKSRIGLRSLEVQLSHDREMYGMQTDFLRDLVKALISRRVDAIERGFNTTMSLYAEQCRHYMAQHEKYSDAHIAARDENENSKLGAKLSDIELELDKIRSDAMNLYREMTRVILIIGGTMPPIAHNDQRALGIVNDK